MSIENKLSEVRNNIISTAKSIGKSPDEIYLVCVTKEVSVFEINQILSLGIKDIGESRVGDALLKYREIDKKYDVKWHMIGHLQTNKVKDAVGIFNLIQSVDSLRLAYEIDKQALRINKIQDILIEVNTSGEDSKFGLKPNEVFEVAKEITKLRNINIKGLMTIAPFVDNPEKTRPYFRMLRQLRDRMNELRIMNYELRVLSMGMSNDYTIAIEEGSNMVRIGSAIFKR